VTAAREVYRCLVCGNVVEVVHSGKGALVCCENPMELLAENSVDASRRSTCRLLRKSAAEPG
jgi:superoxide reductase